jgi:murein DD-endopeptidase MepM/ murein hydrolase activator NlpD
MGGTNPDSPSPTGEVTAETQQIAVASPTASPVPSPTPSPAETIAIPTNSSQPTATLLPEFCSPLAIHPLEELPEIIGDAYDPPRPGREERHHGIDFAYYHYEDRDSMLEEPVQSVMSGVVVGVMDGQYPYGNMLIVETSKDMFPDSLADRLEIPPGQSLYILYAHLDQVPLVAPGESVVACQPFGEVGMSGNTDIPHLHIEFRLGPAGSIFESMRFYDTRATVEEMDTYVLWRTSGTFQHFDPMLLLGPEVELTETPEGN